MKIFLSVITIMTLLSGCRTEDVLPPDGGENPRASVAEKFFPLHIGNSWVFTTTENQVGIMNLDVRRVETINNTKYFVVEQSSNIYRYAIIPRYYRTEDDKVYQYDEEKKKERVVIDFGSEEPNNDQYRYYVTARGEIITVPAGIFTVTSTIAPATMFDGASTDDYAENIGLVQTSFFRGRYMLHHATINGKFIGKK